MVRCLVFDLGAGSGRAMLATYDAERLTLDEIYRFDSPAIEQPDGPHWDVPALKAHVEEGLRHAKRLVGAVDSIGVDSWGVDYALLDRTGTPLEAPYHYRHPRSRRGYDACPLSPRELYASAGTQDLPVNTVHQLADEVRHYPDRISQAHGLLMIADVINHHLTGEWRSEYTLARTSGLLDIQTGRWSARLCRAFDIPLRLLQPLVRPGVRYGLLRPALAGALGWASVPVMAVAAHDTASASAALPLDDRSAFLICGSWSLLGIERPGPLVDDEVRLAGFGNEGGVEGRSLLIKSLNGLHLTQKLRDAWQRRTGQTFDFTELSAMAAERTESGVALDTEAPVLFNPPDMIEAIQKLCAERGTPIDDDLGAMVLAIDRGLAEEVRRNLHGLETIMGAQVPSLRICGGGGRDETLCRVIATAIDRPVRVGPVEASAWGNALLQLLGLGAIATLEQGRKVVERSAEFRDVAPDRARAFDPAGLFH